MADDALAFLASQGMGEDELGGIDWNSMEENLTNGMGNFAENLEKRTAQTQNTVSERILADNEPTATDVANQAWRSATSTVAYDESLHGVLWWLGTRGGQVKHENPNLLAYVTIGRSSENWGKDFVSVGRDVAYCGTGSDEGAFFSYDFGEGYAVACDKYAIVSSRSDSHHPRNWVLEGSADGGSWFELDSRSNDTSLSGVGTKCSFNVSRSGTPHRFLRIRQTGYNSNDALFLRFSYIEFFGSYVVLGEEESAGTQDQSAMQQQQAPFNSVPNVAETGFDYTYQHDMDENGVIYAIATGGGSRVWANPVKSRLMAFTLSAVDWPSAENIATRRASYIGTTNVPDSWVAIDLGPSTSVRPTCYTIMTGRSDSHHLRSWCFEGSVDAGASWVLLSQHVNETALEGAGTSRTWQVDSSSALKGGPDGFRWFRVKQIGPNSSGEHFLRLSNIEIYGRANMRIVDPVGFVPDPSLNGYDSEEEKERNARNQTNSVMGGPPGEMQTYLCNCATDFFADLQKNGISLGDLEGNKYIK